MRLNHNMYSLSIYQSYKKELSENAKALNNISTGQKLNSAKDNPYKIGKNETLKIQVLTNDAASKNIQDTNSMIQTFDGALQEINNNLVRMKELTVQAGSGTLMPEDRQKIQEEIESIKADITTLANNTEFNGVALSDSKVEGITGDNFSVLKSTIGTMDDEKIDVPFYNLSLSSLGLDSIDMNDSDSANSAVDRAIKMVTKVRSEYGSIYNRLEGTADYLSSKDVTIQGAQSKIGDADIAEEMINFSKSQILIQASTALMAQSNKFPQDALNILANVK